MLEGLLGDRLERVGRAEKSPSLGMSVTWTGTLGRLCSDSKIARSLTVVLESPEPMIAIDCPWPMLFEGMS